MKPPLLQIAAALKKEAEALKGYAPLAKEINATFWREEDELHTVASKRELTRAELELQKKKASVRGPIDRRKLKRIADGLDFTISTQELLAIDLYFRDKGEGFSDKPLFARRSLLESLAENEQATFFVGAFARDREERTDVSMWDVRAYQEIYRGMSRFRPGVRGLLRDIQFFDRYGSPNKERKPVDEILGERRHSVCSIGSTRANTASEIILAEMFNIKPFAYSGDIPFKFFWEEDPKSPTRSTSSFRVKEADLKRDDPLLLKSGRTGRTSALIVGSEVYCVLPQRNSDWDDYGIVAAQRQDQDRIQLVVAGLSGPSTFACAIACNRLLSQSLSREIDGAVLWYVVRCRIRPGTGIIGDTRSVIDAHVAHGPEISRPIKVR